MKARNIGTIALLVLAAVAAGCASDSGGLVSTSSVAPDKVAAAAPKIDPACVTLSSQIDSLRKEGAVERLEKAASGKTASVQVKRTSLAKQAELNKANADFQAKCGPSMPKAQTAQAAPQAAIAVPAAATQAAASVAPTAATAVAGAATQQAKAAVTSAATSAAQTAVQVAPKN